MTQSLFFRILLVTSFGTPCRSQCICVYVFVHLWVCTVYVSAFVCVGTITDGDGGKTRDGVTLVPAGNGSPPETFQIHPLFAFSQVHLLLSISVHFPRPFSNLRLPLCPLIIN